MAAAIAGLAGDSELEKAQFRAAAPTCAACHRNFDAFGMVLEPYDAVGRLRTADLEGRPIDASWTTTVLPKSVGGATVTSAAETGRALATSGALDRCMAMNFINYALTEVSRGGANNTDLSRAPQTGSCAVQGVIDRFAATDRSFASLMREIAASDTLRVPLERTVMQSYRFARRAFLGGIGGAFGLEICSATWRRRRKERARRRGS